MASTGFGVRGRGRADGSRGWLSEVHACGPLAGRSSMAPDRSWAPRA